MVRHFTREALVVRYLKILAFMVGFIGPGPAAASGSQLSPPGLTGGACAGWFWTRGEDFDETDGAPGVDVHVSFPLWRMVGLSIGAHYSDHGMTTRLPRDASLYGMYLEPRITFDRPVGSVFPFFGFRVVMMRRDVTNAESSLSIRTEGSALGGSGGFMLHLAGPAWIEAEAIVSRLSLDPYTVATQRDKGTLVTVQIGVSVALARTPH